MEWFENIFSLGFALILFIPIGVLIMFFWNTIFWFVGGLLRVKNPFWRIRAGGLVVLTIYTIILFKIGLY
tara:strand:- start:372 stop:581 length:210 start_codon:yes stop_codon:yes gene_type:complete